MRGASANRSNEVICTHFHPMKKIPLNPPLKKGDLIRKFYHVFSMANNPNNTPRPKGHPLKG